MFSTEERKIWLAPVSVDNSSSNEIEWHVRITTRDRFPPQIRKLLQKQPADRVLLQASSEAQTYFPSDPIHLINNHDWAVRSNPGVSVAIANSTAPERLFQQLVLQHRLLLTSTNIQTRRLHRYAFQKDGVWSIVLPTEGSAAISVEGLRAWLTKDDTAAEWSNWLLETALRHRIWIELENDTIERGLQYTVRSTSLTKLKEIFPVPMNRQILADPIRMEIISKPLSKVAWNPDLCELAEQSTCYLRSTVSMDERLLQSAISTARNDEISLQVDYHLYTAMAHTGTLFTRIHTNVPTTVHQHLPPVLQPRWTSLKVQTESGQSLDWNSLLAHEIVFDDDGVHLSYGWNESFSMSLQFEPRFWSIDSIPGDPNRGIELPPLVVDFGHGTLSSNTVLLLPPLPDLSMPFNVLSLSCTLYAFIIGSTMSLLIRKASQAVQEELDPSKKPPSKIQLLKGKLTTLLNKKLRRKTETGVDRSKEESLSPPNDEAKVQGE